MSDRISDDLADTLLNDDDVHALVSDRIYPQIRVQNVGVRGIAGDLPAVIYDHDGRSFPITTDGEMTLTTQGWRLVCYTERYQDLEDLAKAVTRVLSGHVSSCIREILVGAVSDDYDEETNVHERQIDLTVTAWI